MQKIIILSLILWGFWIQLATGQDGLSCNEALTALQGINISDNAVGDQWFFYTATMDGKVTVSTCGLTSANTFLEVFDGCDLEAFASSNDFCDSQSEISFEVVDGLTYYICWRSYYTNQEYEWSLSETSLAQGEFCSYPLVADVGYNISEIPENKYCWFEFIASQDGKVTINATGENADDCHVAVYDDCSFTSTLNNDLSWNPSNIAFDAVEGESYLISWQNESDSGEIEWAIEEGYWEAGERCIDPIDIDVSEENAIDHESSTNKWYRYIARENAEITISSVGLTSEDTYLEVYAGCGEERVYFNDDATDLQSEITMDVEVGKVYLLKWDRIFTPESYAWSLKSDQISTDLSDIDENELNLYPNPTQGIVYADLTSFDSNTVRVKVMSLSGATVKAFELSAGIVATFNVSDLNTGFYSLVFEDLVSRKVVKLLKQ